MAAQKRIWHNPNLGGQVGQGPAIGLGMALAMRLDESPARVWVLVGDSETAEGSVWEAMEAASHHRVANLTCVIDLNRLGQRGPTMHGWDADVFVARAEAFGWNALSIDGHDVVAIDRAYRAATEDDRPTMIVARTEKGHGVKAVANDIEVRLPSFAERTDAGYRLVEIRVELRRAEYDWRPVVELVRERMGEPFASRLEQARFDAIP